MEHSRRANALMAVSFCALIVAEPVVQLAHDYRSGVRPAALDIFFRSPSSANLRAYEDSLREQSVIADSIRPAWQYWRFAAMSDAGSNGMVGRDGWLFYEPGIRFLVEPWTDEDNAEALTAIESFRDQLDERGIELLVLIVPGKESVHPELLTGRARQAVNDHVTRFTNALRERGVNALYLMPEQTTFRALYLKQDTHWTPQYATECAQRVAAFVLDQGWAVPGGTEYAVRDITVKRHGDLLRMAKSKYVLKTFEAELIACQQVIDPRTGAPYRDNPDASILVLGDSFLRIFERDEPTSAGFVSHLARALKQPVTSLINDGGASTLVREELRRKPELLRGKKLVIWEFVDRDLRYGIDGWREVQLENDLSTTSIPGQISS